MELIQLIHEELLKSAELTGIWEKKLREIEKRSYDAATFISELKQMVTEIVYSVIRDTSNRRVTVTSEEDVKAAAKRGSAGKDAAAKSAPRKKAVPKTEKVEAKTGSSVSAAQGKSPVKTENNTSGAELFADDIVGKVCPLCGKGTIIKGKTAYGCSEWKNGCGFRKPF